MSETLPEREAMRGKVDQDSDTEGHGFKSGRVTEDEQAGEQEAWRSGRVIDDEEDVAGHAMRPGRADEGAEPGEQEAFRSGRVSGDEDAEGHAVKIGR